MGGKAAKSSKIWIPFKVMAGKGGGEPQREDCSNGGVCLEYWPWSVDDEMALGDHSANHCRNLPDMALESSRGLRLFAAQPIGNA